MMIVKRLGMCLNFLNFSFSSRVQPSPRDGLFSHFGPSLQDGFQLATQPNSVSVSARKSARTVQVCCHLQNRKGLLSIFSKLQLEYIGRSNIARMAALPPSSPPLCLTARMSLVTFLSSTCRRQRGAVTRCQDGEVYFTR